MTQTGIPISSIILCQWMYWSSIFIAHIQTHRVQRVLHHTQLSFCAVVSLILPDLVDMTNLIIMAVQTMVPSYSTQQAHKYTHTNYMHARGVRVFHGRVVYRMPPSGLFLILFLLLSHLWGKYTVLHLSEEIRIPRLGKSILAHRNTICLNHDQLLFTRFLLMYTAHYWP